MLSTYIKTTEGLFTCGCNGGKLGIQGKRVNVLTKVDIPLVVDISHNMVFDDLFLTAHGELYSTMDGTLTKLDIPEVIKLGKNHIETVEGVYVMYYDELIHIGHDIVDIGSTGCSWAMLNSAGQLSIFSGGELKVIQEDVKSISVGWGILSQTKDALYDCSLGTIAKVDVPRVTAVLDNKLYKIVNTVDGVYEWKIPSDVKKLEIPEVLSADCGSSYNLFYTVDGLYYLSETLDYRYSSHGAEGRVKKVCGLPTIIKAYFGMHYAVYHTIDGVYARGVIFDEVFDKRLDVSNPIEVITADNYFMIVTENSIYINGIMSGQIIDRSFDISGEVVVYGRHIIIHKVDGYYAFGDNRYGQLGLGHNEGVTEFTKIPNFDYKPLSNKKFIKTKSARKCV